MCTIMCTPPPSASTVAARKKKNLHVTYCTFAYIKRHPKKFSLDPKKPGFLETKSQKRLVFKPGS